MAGYVSRLSTESAKVPLSNPIHSKSVTPNQNKHLGTDKLKTNSSLLHFICGTIKWYQQFRPGNPIHDVLSIESEITGSKGLEKAYETVKNILVLVKKAIQGKNLSPQQKLKTVYDIMKFIGIKFEDQDNPLFTENINRYKLDCDTSSFVVIAVAYEMGWPVYLVNTPGHVFVRWDDGKGTRFNMDTGERYSDEFYVRWKNIPRVTILIGGCLKNLERPGFLSLFYKILGIAKNKLGDYGGAIKAYNKASELNSRDSESYFGLGLAKGNLGDYEGAIKAYNKAIRRNPRQAQTYNNLGIVKYELGDGKVAIEAFSKAIELKPRHMEYYRNRGKVREKLGDTDGSKKDFKTACELSHSSCDYIELK